VRTRAPLGACLLGALAAAGCGFGGDVGPPGTGPFPHQGGVGGAVPSTAPVYRIQPQGATVIQPGTQAGYGITANFGGAYRLVWSGAGGAGGTYREFWGSIYTPSHFGQIVSGCADSSCTLQRDDYVSPIATTSGGERVDFDAIAEDNNLDGFDLYVDAEPVYFDLRIDGSAYPQLVFFAATDQGGQVVNATALPFGLTTH
jgi:hypothetical protein